MSETYRWIKIADSVTNIPFGDNHIAEVSAEGKKICVAQFKNELFAFTPTCPHASGQFINGSIDMLGNVVCPLHRYKFCLKNGRNSSGEGYCLKHWPVQIKEDGVFVGLAPTKLFHLL